MKSLNKLISFALCLALIINSPLIVYGAAVIDDSNDIHLYSVPVESNEYSKDTVTFYEFDGKYFLDLESVKDFTRCTLTEDDETITLTHGIREIVIDKSTGHMTDSGFVDQGNIVLLEYDGEYLCEGIPMLIYLGATCTINEHNKLKVLMPAFTIWESIMPDYLDYHFSINELYGGEDNVKISLICDIIADVLDGVSGHGLMANADTHLEDALYEILNVDMMKYSSVKEISSAQNQKINDFLSSAVFETMLDTGDNMYDTVYEAFDYYFRFYVSSNNDILLDMMTETDDLEYASELASQIKEQVYSQSAAKANLKNAKKAQGFMDIGMLAFDIAITSYNMMQYNDDTKNLFARTINQEMFKYADYYDISWNNVSDKISSTLKNTQSIVAKTAIDNVTKFAMDKVNENVLNTALSMFTSKANIYTAAVQISSFLSSLIKYESNQAFSADMNAIWLSAVQYDVAMLVSSLLVKERDEFQFSNAKSLEKLKDMFTLYYRTTIAFSENVAKSIEEFGTNSNQKWVPWFSSTTEASVGNHVAAYLYRITNCKIVPIVDFSEIGDGIITYDWISDFKVDCSNLNLLDGYWENFIQAHKVYQFFDDGTVKEYDAEPGARPTPENLSYSCTLQYEWDGKSLIIGYGDGLKRTLEQVTNDSPVEWDTGLKKRLEEIPDGETFFYETGWKHSGLPSDNALYFVKSRTEEFSGNVDVLYDNDTLSVSGILVEQDYDKGTAYILKLDSPIKKSLYSDWLGYSGEIVEIDEIQISFSYHDEYIRNNLLNNHIEVTGTVMYAHTGHHLTTVLLMDAL